MGGHGRNDKPQRQHRNRKPRIDKGDLYAVTNRVESLDLDADGSEDLRMTHTVTRNDELFFQSEAVWYGIDSELATAFAAQFADLLAEEEAVGDFGELVHHWRRQNKAMSKIMQAGALIAAKIGEPASDDD